MNNINFSNYSAALHFIEKKVGQGVQKEFEFFYTTDDSFLRVLEDVDYLMIKRGLGDKVKLSLKEVTPDRKDLSLKFDSYLSKGKKYLLKIKVIPV